MYTALAAITANDSVLISCRVIGRWALTISRAESDWLSWSAMGCCRWFFFSHGINQADLAIKNPADGGVMVCSSRGSGRKLSQLCRREVSRGVIAAFRNGGKYKLSSLKTLSFQLLFFDQCEGVHVNLLQRLKPRCLLEIELRHFNVANV